MSSALGWASRTTAASGLAASRTGLHACLGSLRTSRPLIYRFVLEVIGADTAKGRDFDARWQDPEFRRPFRLFTTVWGGVYLAEAAARVIIVEATTTATALTVSKVMPYAVAVALVAWMNAYGRRAKRTRQRLAATPSAEATPMATSGHRGE